MAGWQRESLSWGVAIAAGLLAMTGLVSPWGIVVLPLVVAGVVKAHDLLAGRLAAVESGAPNSNEPPVETTEGSADPA